MFSSLSKRSNVPGMRSGFVAGDAAILKQFLLYRTYHGCAMSPAVQAASLAAWSDEAHVADNRRLYREKFAPVTPICCGASADRAAGRRLLPVGDARRSRRSNSPAACYAEYNVIVLPGSYLARDASGSQSRRRLCPHRAGRPAGRVPRRRPAHRHLLQKPLIGPDMQAISEHHRRGLGRPRQPLARQAPAKIGEAVDSVIDQLDSGKLRVAEKIDGQWVTHQWIKKAVLLSFRLEDNVLIEGGETRYFDKVPSKFANYDREQFARGGFRVVPPADCAARLPSSRKNVVLMPSYVNIGAYVDEGTMVDTWVTVGSCAQIGKNVHLSGGVGIGGVLEPLQANPTIIEDNCFIGARSEVVEGVIVEENSVISMGVYISQSTRIYDRETGEITLWPHSARVRSWYRATCPRPTASYSLYCAVIVKQVDAQTRAKTSINDLLRD